VEPPIATDGNNSTPAVRWTLHGKWRWSLSWKFNQFTKIPGNQGIPREFPFTKQDFLMEMDVHPRIG
jgi:hypothetical protein